MEKNIKKIFEILENVEPSVGLEEKILKNIASQESWQKKKKIIFADILSFVSVGTLAFVIFNWGKELIRSEFWNIAKLLFSDTAVVAVHWKEFLFSLLETFPAFHFAILLTPFFVLLMAMEIYFGNDGNYYRIK